MPVKEALSDFTREAEAFILSIPPGRVCTYGQVARAAGNPRAARQVARLLHSRAETAGLPWQRIVGAGPGRGRGRVMLGGEGLSQQVALLRAEGVEVTEEGLIDLEAYAWDGVGR